MPYEAVSFPIGGKDVYRGLVVLYSFIVLYAMATVYFGAQTVETASGSTYGLFFPIALLLTSVGALWGVVRSRYTRQVWLEYAGTLGLLAGLVSYMVAIVIVAVRTGEVYRYPGALLPAMIMVFPVLRLRNILKVVKERAARRAATKRALAAIGEPR